MASWESRSWPARRWLADRLVGQHAYSRNVVTPGLTHNQTYRFDYTNTSNYTHDAGYRITPRDPGETA